MKDPLIVDIKRHSLEDGPGIRSVAFFKGCPLRCIFCHSPETQHPRQEIAFFPGRCSSFRHCAAACPENAVDDQLPGRLDRQLCTRCGLCVQACPTGSLSLIGRPFTVDELSEILLRDLPFYRHSGGGVTLSGGESTLYPRYLEQLLQRLKAAGIHVALETCGHFRYQAFQRRILPYLDLIYFDVKFADAKLHRRFTGRSNARILRNLRRLLQEKRVEVHPRTPLVPAVTATRENLLAIGRLLRAYGAKDHTLLPYNPMGIAMAECLGRPRPPLPDRFMKQEEEERLREMLQAQVRQGSSVTGFQSSAPTLRSAES